MQSIGFEEIEAGLASLQSHPTLAKGKNPLVEAAIPLFTVASQMKYCFSGLSTSEMLGQLKRMIEEFEESAEIKGVRYETVRAARYCLCTLLDEFAVKYGWGNQEWMTKSLLVSFHNETWGGEQFFQLFDQIKNEPEKNIQLIELMYYCLVLGYMGKYQVLNNGQVGIYNLKREMEKLIQQYKVMNNSSVLIDKSKSERLSQRSKRIIPIWVIAAISGLGLFALYQVLDYRLNAQVDDLDARIMKLQPDSALEQEQLMGNQRLSPLLRNEIANGLIVVTESENASKITILGDELFASGSDKIEDRYFPVLASVSQALNVIKGQIIVSGHTDDRPINSPTYPSNWHLSQGRADAVKQIILKYIEDGSRVRSEGKGDQNPTVPNSSDANRAKNRRVEIVIYLDANSPDLPTTEGVQSEMVK